MQKHFKHVLYKTFWLHTGLCHGVELYVTYCNCIVTKGGVNNEILPEPEGFPEGSGNISLYPPTQVTIQSFSIT